MTSIPTLATERAALVLQLVPYLISKGEVSVAEAADEFDVPAAEMKRMVEKLTVIGLPGDGGFWQMANDLFDIDWDLLDEREIISLTNRVGLERAPRLTAREAAALLAGLQLSATLPGVGESGAVQSLLGKLAAGASSTPPDVVVASDAVDEVRTMVADALRRRVALTFTYQAPDRDAMHRTVDPVKVHIADGQWYLQGWCHLRHGMRTFHLERVRDVQVSDTPATHSTEPAPALFGGGDGDAHVRVRLRAALAPLAPEIAAREELGDGWVAGDMRVADARIVKRIAARFGGDLIVDGPGEAKAAVRDWAGAALELYD